MAFKPSPEGETEVHSGLSLCELILISQYEFLIISCMRQRVQLSDLTTWASDQIMALSTPVLSADKVHIFMEIFRIHKE